MLTRRWQNWAAALVGLWVFGFPWLLPYFESDHAAGPAVWNFYITGVAVLVTALATLFAFRPWEKWVNVVLALWLIASPWLLEFSPSFALTATAVASGTVVLALSASALFAEAGESPA
jgi:hypothetical protein